MENNESSEVIQVNNLTKRFSHITAVDNISFAIKRGDIFGFLGPNGAGKTTTLNMLCTLINPTKGDALVGGFSIVKNPLMVRKNIGIVFQESTLDNHLTVKENLYLHAKLYGMTNNDFKKQLHKVINLVELDDKLNTPISELSGGTKRRIEIARVLLHKPKIIFLDEPTIGLDAQTRNKIWEYLLKIRKEENATIFLTTQYIHEAEICDYIGVIDYGEIVALNTPENLKSTVKKDTIEIATIDNQKTLLQIKENFKDISACQIGKNIIIQTERGETKLPQILDIIDSKIISINLTRPTLEDVFLNLTGRKIRDKKD